MSKHNAYHRESGHKESGNAVVIVLVVLVIAAVGGLVYLSGQMGDKNKDKAAPGSQTAAAAQANPAATQTADSQGSQAKVKPGNPVVAKLNGDEIMRMDVFNYIQQLPPNVRQQPVQQLFPLAQDQVITARVIEAKTKKVNMDADPDVKKQLAAAKEQIVRAAYINKQVTKRMTEERLKKAYDSYLKNFPDIDEVKARHILVESEDKAKEVLVKLKEDGASFEELAKEYSTDGTAANGGSLGYFSKNDNLVPEFLEAAFKIKVGEYSKKPVKTQFGYHIIKIDEARKRPPADFKTAKPFLEAEIRRVVLNELIQDWRKEMKIERFDINGNAIEPAAGGDNKAPAAAQ